MTAPSRSKPRSRSASSDSNANWLKKRRANAPAVRPKLGAIDVYGFPARPSETTGAGSSGAGSGTSLSGASATSAEYQVIQRAPGALPHQVELRLRQKHLRFVRGDVLGADAVRVLEAFRADDLELGDLVARHEQKLARLVLRQVAHHVEHGGRDLLGRERLLHGVVGHPGKILGQASHCDGRE